MKGSRTIEKVYLLFILLCLFVLAEKVQAAEYVYYAEGDSIINDCENNPGPSASNGKGGQNNGPLGGGPGDPPGIKYSKAGILRWVFAKYDTTTNTLTWQANFLPCQDRVPNGFTLVLNNGPMPPGDSAGEYAIIYFDASYLSPFASPPGASKAEAGGEGNSPILNVFSYNGIGALNSKGSYRDGNSQAPGFQPPDRILTNRGSAALTNWVKELIARDEDDGSRTLGFTIDATKIIGHSPAYPSSNSWFGIGFFSQIGYWLKPVSGLITRYCEDNNSFPLSAAKSGGSGNGKGKRGAFGGSGPIGPGPGQNFCDKVIAGQSSNGFLAKFQVELAGIFDGTDQTANSVPFCTVQFGQDLASLINAGVFRANWSPVLHSAATSGGEENRGGEGVGQDPDCITANIGSQTNIIVRGDDIDSSQLKVTYSGVPQGAQVLTADGSGNPQGPLGNGDVMSVPSNVLLRWTPQLSDGGGAYNVIFTFNDMYLMSTPFNKESETLCSVNICVPQNEAPSCNLTVTSGEQCEGTVTTVNLSVSGSDPEQDPLQYNWTTTCENSNGEPESLTVSDTQTEAVLSLTKPGEGLSANCKVTVEVSDPFQSSTCSVNVNVAPCDLDCMGDPNGTAVVDQCGVCGGDGTSCLDCAGVPFGTAVVDQCGVCGGNNECLDCAGVPFGTAVVDQCGVCGGDGTSCLLCQTSDISQLQATLDGGALEIRRLARIGLVKLKRMDINRNKPDPKRKHTGFKIRRRSLKYARKMLKRADEFYMDAWHFAWAVPSVNVQCQNTELCFTVDNAKTVESYKQQVTNLTAVVKAVVKRLRRTAKKRGIGKRKRRKMGVRLLRRAERKKAKFLALSDQVPTSFSQCTVQ